MTVYPSARACLILAALAASSPIARAEVPAAAAEPTSGEERFLARVRQLTFAGRRAGEGYFSQDGTRFVFQSEREADNPFFQIYELDLSTGTNRRVSPGVGKTTCAFFRPGTGEILFASTHHDPRSRELQEAELAFRASGQTRRYEWDFDPEMELYVTGEGAAAPRRLTSARGYDAEGSYSPDGAWIVFTTNREAYAGEPSEADRARLETDPSYFAEIYRMKADGSAVERLTAQPGYDGGPFYTADGQWIVWRRFDEPGLIADVWRMRADGTGAERLTDFGAMSWAPFPHPSGEYVVFTSNKHGFGNFELFLVDAAGTKEPVRVTYTDGFDGLPVLSPDGGQLAWTSTRRSAQAQILLAEWSHAAALEALREAPPRRPAAARE
jgi:Tol biopolymer transport system component